VTVLALVLGTASRALSTTITVNSNADSLAIDGNCTLREAIIAANTDTAVDACAAGSGADVVMVPAGTYTLTLVGPGEDAAATGDLDVTASADIVGSPAGVIIDGNGADRVLDIDPSHAGGVVVTLTAITVRNGAGVAQGGGIRNAGTLTLTSSRVTASTATAGADVVAEGGGIESVGSLQLIASTVDGNEALALPTSAGGLGGGIHSDGGPLVVTDSTIRDNGATQNVVHGGPQVAGGGIDCGSSVLTLSRSTVSGNSALGSPPTAPGLGGGIAGCSGSIVNGTISGNHASIGDQIAVVGGTLAFSNSTIDYNLAAGGGETLVFQNTIVAGCFDIGGFTTVADDHNLDTTDSCKLSGTDLRGVDPLLGPLADNGGPTQTRMPQVGSPASDAGNPGAPGSGGLTCEATDQRGVARPVGPRCDIGAFEGMATGTTSTTTTSTSTTTTTTICGPAPRTDCQPALGEKSKLTLKKLPGDAKDSLSWSWPSSAAVPAADFQDPVNGPTDYIVCVYDQAGRRLESKAPFGGTCGTKPCWKRTASGKIIYSDKLLDPDGILKLVLKPGPAAGKARIQLKGKGANLRMPGFPLTTPVRLQLLRHTFNITQSCWDANFSTSTHSDGERFSARSDP
jgi:CSLREA domain-containing protein